MKQNRFACLALAALMLAGPAQAEKKKPAGETDKQKEARMEWFDNAKLGVFIHWGIYG